MISRRLPRPARPGERWPGDYVLLRRGGLVASSRSASTSDRVINSPGEGLRVSGPEGIAAVPDRRSSAQRAAHVIAAVLVVVVLPVVLMDVLVGGFGADAMFVGLLWGLLGGKLGGT